MWKLLAVAFYLNFLLVAGLPKKIQSDDDNRVGIIGGEDADIVDYPWQVSVRNFLSGISHFCGGSIIHPSWILTAAHCLDGLTPIQYEIVAGISNVHLPSIHEEIRRVENGIMHPSYNWNDKEFDIGLIHLNSPLTLTDYIQTVELNTVPELEEGTLCTATGWGVTVEDSLFLSANLQKVEVPVVSDETCLATYGFLMRDDMLCAGEEGKDSCSGDSGGPLVCGYEDGTVGKLAGVTSWGQGCGRPGKPGVYTEVAYFADWIQQTLESYGDSLEF